MGKETPGGGGDSTRIVALKEESVTHIHNVARQCQPRELESNSRGVYGCLSRVGRGSQSWSLPFGDGPMLSWTVAFWAVFFLFGVFWPCFWWTGGWANLFRATAPRASSFLFFAILSMPAQHTGNQVTVSYSFWHLSKGVCSCCELCVAEGEGRGMTKADACPGLSKLSPYNSSQRWVDEPFAGLEGCVACKNVACAAWTGESRSNRGEK